MEAITGVFGEDHKFGELLKDMQEKAVRGGIRSGVVALIDNEGRLVFDWVGNVQDALAMVGRCSYEINKWIDGYAKK